MTKKLMQELNDMASEDGFRKLFSSPCKDDYQPELTQLSYGGDYHYSDEGAQVELHGDFSKSDLIKIADQMHDSDDCHNDDKYNCKYCRKETVDCYGGS